jgi:hypothetical protein
MGGNSRNPKDYIFKKPLPKPKEVDSPRPKNIAPPWIDLDELAFGKEPKKPNPKVDKPT